MKKIIFATGNADKMKEIRKILADLDAEVVSMKEAGIQADIVEDGKTFEENARDQRRLPSANLPVMARSCLLMIPDLRLII